MSYANPILAEREATHGDYTRTAEIAQRLKNVFRDSGYERLPAVHRESLDMIATKMARVLSGDPANLDHWLDIAGYAELVPANQN